jgi:hypothetical protein
VIVAVLILAILQCSLVQSKSALSLTTLCLRHTCTVVFPRDAPVTRAQFSFHVLPPSHVHSSLYTLCPRHTCTVLFPRYAPVTRAQFSFHVMPPSHAHVHFFLSTLCLSHTCTVYVCEGYSGHGNCCSNFMFQQTVAMVSRVFTAGTRQHTKVSFAHYRSGVGLFFFFFFFLLDTVHNSHITRLNTPPTPSLTSHTHTHTKKTTHTYHTNHTTYELHSHLTIHTSARIETNKNTYCSQHSLSEQNLLLLILLY